MAYDGEGHRVALVVNGGTPTYYLGQLEEIAGGALTKYFQVNDLPTALRVGTGGAISYLASDGLGSVDEALNSSGSVSFQQLFSAIGTVLYSSGTSPTSYGFTGQRTDGASGLVYFNARYYDPTGRQFTSADTVQDGLNAFAYVFDNHRDLD